jgi:hypothetical protein
MHSETRTYHSAILMHSESVQNSLLKRSACSKIIIQIYDIVFRVSVNLGTVIVDFFSYKGEQATIDKQLTLHCFSFPTAYCVYRCTCDK